ncbi:MULTISPECIES: hypothetical protein [Sphingomonadaceae]|jgi:hypothetical protein|uniref:Inner membrane protein n=1 Tax=Novosphingobium cyanobacteriorum TaxID=3024215 RepID=A0ABT6CFU8_9SPHN|nr:MULTISPECIES: hypothetical protein [Sphingomonadaceae]ALC14680.1 inner membrane protein [Sphingopyxis sp. 113P3]MDF8332795.1 hypothetical protein [Novosphingobium cyanobacteriorum]
MLTDSERFAFTAHRIHAFETTGNAYDATQIDEAIETGDTLLVHAEGVVAVAMTWPFAITTAHGHLHSMAPSKDGDTLEIVAESLKVEPGAIRRAAEFARQLGFEIDPAVAPLLA